jgi:hypothetical protein
MFLLFIRPHLGMENHGRLDNGNVPLAQKEHLLGGSEQEGGDATKDTVVENELGHGNRQHITSGATSTTERAEEGLDEDAANLGSEVQRTDE